MTEYATLYKYIENKLFQLLRFIQARLIELSLRKLVSSLNLHFLKSLKCGSD